MVEFLPSMPNFRTVGDTQYNMSSQGGFTGWQSAMMDKSRAATEKWFEDRSSNAMASNGAADAAAQAAAMKEAAALKAKAAAESKALQAQGMSASINSTRDATTLARDDVNPWRVAGIDALGKLQAKMDAGPGDFTADPGYQFRLEEGQKAIERSAAAKGNALSGAAVKAATRYGQGFASNEYDNFMRRYYESMEPFERMSNTGLQAAGMQGDYSVRGAAQEAAIRTGATNQMASDTKYGGEAMAGGVMDSANIIAAEAQAANERDYAYQAWKEGSDF